MEEYSMVDIWRIRHPNLQTFTRHENHRNGLVQSRLDYWLLSSRIILSNTSCKNKTRLLLRSQLNYNNYENK